MTFVDTQNPIFQSVLAPLVIAAFLVGLFFLYGRQSRGSGFAICGAAVAILVAYWLIFSLPPFPPRSSGQKLGYLFAAAAALSLLYASRPDMMRTWRLVTFALIFLGLAWISESKLKQEQYGIVLMVEVAAAVALSGLLLAREQPVETGAAMLIAALAVAGIAALAPSASITQMALAIAAATGGYLLWTWPKPRLEFAEAGAMAVGAPLIWLGGQASLYSKASDPALALVVLVAFGPLIRRVTLGQSLPLNDALRPIITAFITAAFAALAILIAYLGQTAQSDYGG